MPTLIHEQLHFDICEYFRRLFLQKIKETSFTPEVMPAVVKAIFRMVADQRKQMEKDYDRETGSGQKSDMQVKWKDKVQRLLSSTDVYAKHSISLKGN